MISVWNDMTSKYRRLCFKIRCWVCLGALLEAIKNGWRPKRSSYTVTFDAVKEKLIADDPWHIVANDATDHWSLLVCKLRRLAFKRRCWLCMGFLLRDAHGRKHGPMTRGC